MTDLQKQIDDLNEDLVKASDAKEALRDQMLEAGAKQREIADELSRLEQQHGDDQAEAALRDRGGTDGAMAANAIAATMGDPDRAKRFQDLAQELLDQ